MWLLAFGISIKSYLNSQKIKIAWRKCVQKLVENTFFGSTVAMSLLQKWNMTKTHECRNWNWNRGQFLKNTFPKKSTIWVHCTKVYQQEFLTLTPGKNFQVKIVLFWHFKHETLFPVSCSQFWWRTLHFFFIHEKKNRKKKKAKNKSNF